MVMGGERAVSRWAELFVELSNSADTVDTPRHSAAVSQTVNSVTAAPAHKSEIPRGHSVNSVYSVSAAIAKNREDRESTRAEEDPTGGSASGGLIDSISGDWARSAAPRTLRTQLTQWAEECARLNPDHPPANVPLSRWRRLTGDCQRLLADGFFEEASRLGWTARDLFGCDDTKPFARVDQMGLVWFMNGGRVVSMSMSAAVIETATGAKQTYRRKDDAPGSVPVWQLFKRAGAIE
jgi:hypothetical protein